MRVWIKRSLWILFGIGVLVLLFMVQNSQSETVLSKPEIVIHVKGESAFLTEDELYVRLKRKGFIFNGQAHQDLKIAAIEKYIKSMSEVKDVGVYTKIGSSWKIDVDVRKPIARVFNKYDENFYLDEDGFIMKSSNLHTARVVVVTGYIKDRINSISVDNIINNDTL